MGYPSPPPPPQVWTLPSVILRTRTVIISFRQSYPAISIFNLSLPAAKTVTIVYYVCNLASWDNALMLKARGIPWQLDVSWQDDRRKGWTGIEQWFFFLSLSVSSLNRWMLPIVYRSSSAMTWMRVRLTGLVRKNEQLMCLLLFCISDISSLRYIYTNTYPHSMYVIIYMDAKVHWERNSIVKIKV